MSVKTGLSGFQNFCYLSHLFYLYGQKKCFFLSLYIKLTQLFICLLRVFLFISLLVLSNLIFRRVLFIISSLIFLFMKNYWFTRTYLFIKWPCFLRVASSVSLNVLKGKALKFLLLLKILHESYR